MTTSMLEEVLDGIATMTVAVSGGVDSMTLAAFAHRQLGVDAVTAVHATSPAVPPEATRRVSAFAAAEGWALRVIDAGEFADARYRANPINRCFFCKTNLYAAVAAGTDALVVSGTNTDDLGEYRPGLEAARQHGVRHPYVEAGMDKVAVRALAHRLGFSDLADLPASPCLSSRVETGLRIEPETLGFIHAVERLVAARLGASTGAATAVRCRVRATSTIVELDPSSLAALDATDRAGLAEEIGALAPRGLGDRLAFAPYRVGSAFVAEGPR